MKTLMILGDVMLRLGRRVEFSDVSFRRVVDGLRKSKAAWTELAETHLLDVMFDDELSLEEMSRGPIKWSSICIQVLKDGQWHDVAFDDTDDPSLGTGRVEAK